MNGNIKQIENVSEFHFINVSFLILNNISTLELTELCLSISFSITMIFEVAIQSYDIMSMDKLLFIFTNYNDNALQHD